MADSVKLRVMSYNVHGQHDDQQALAATVRAQQPDVVIVQEAPRRFRWRTKAGLLAHRLNMFVAAGGLPSLGNLLLTSARVQVGRTHCLQYPLTPGRHMRGAAFAECRVGGARFVVVGSHLSTDAAERPAQARALRREMRKVTHPLVLGTDLNETAGGPAYQELVAGLTDVAAQVGDDRPTFSCHAPARRIDVLLVQPSVVIRRYAVVDDDLCRRASDHFPIVADLEIPVS